MKTIPVAAATLLWMALSLIHPSVGTAQSEAYLSPMLPELYSSNADSFIVIAHRGASAYYPENTMAAFRAAVEQQAEMIELDVLLSADGVPVVIHDGTLNRTTNGRGPVAEHTLAELQKLDAGSWFDAQFAGEQIPTLEEVLQFARGTIALNIEIKTEAVTDEHRGGIEEKSLQLVKKYGMERHVLFSSFDYRAVEHLKKLDASISAALLYERRQSAGRSPQTLVAHYNADAFNCSYRQYSRKWQAGLHQEKIPVFIYTVDDPGRMEKLINRDVRGIFSNRPDTLHAVAKRVLGMSGS